MGNVASEPGVTAVGAGAGTVVSLCLAVRGVWGSGTGGRAGDWSESRDLSELKCK